MTKSANEMKVYITRDIPGIGIEMLKAEGFDVSVWPHDRPMSPEELITAGKEANAFITLSTDTIDANFLNECSQLDIISQFAAGYDNINIDEATRLNIP